MSDHDATQIASEHVRALRAFLQHYTVFSGAHAVASDESALVDAYLDGIDAREVFTVTAAIDALLRRDCSDADVGRELRANGLAVVPHGRDGTARGWLRDVRHRLAQ